MISRAFLSAGAVLYKHVVKPVLFMVDPEIVHERMTRMGEILGGSNYLKKSLALFYLDKYPALEQDIKGIHFANPIGLSAGFDYEARLTQITPSLGFGFHTVGTITRNAYGGNARPILGRLPRSRSLMVNKGFKNKGVHCVMRHLYHQDFAIPVGISIGRTNTASLKTHEECVQDILASFEASEKSHVRHSYYELNISCPNLVGNVSFYDPDELDKLLTALDGTALSRPLFIKMPIECDDEKVLSLLEVISKHAVHGVIFGNLQKNRNDESLDKQEVAKFATGNFSGKPTEKRSNELISLVYRKYGERFTIIGCGGVFSAEDAYKKILLGASLVQLITGMIYNGPQLIAQINQGLVKLLKQDGYGHISEAVGAAHRNV
jgi:dihydroorotate dehydrogenase